jgi:hypothetical protein
MTVDTDQLQATNRTAIFDALVAAGIDKLIVSYSGSGDSGQIDSVHLDDAACTEPRLPQEIAYTEYGTNYMQDAAGTWAWVPYSNDKVLPLREAIESFCYDELEGEYAGWENNDGADGTFTFDVEERRVYWTHNEFYTESNTYEHEV